MNKLKPIKISRRKKQNYIVEVESNFTPIELHSFRVYKPNILKGSQIKKAELVTNKFMEIIEDNKSYIFLDEINALNWI